MRKLFDLALSDPSPLELLAVIIGIVFCTASFFYLFVQTGYEAGLIASPVNPFGSVKGYISGLGHAPPVLSQSTIRLNAARVFLNLLYGIKIEVWLIFMVALFITGYPILARLRSTIIPGLSITGISLDRILWMYLLPVVLIYLGYSSLFLVMTASIFKFYFGVAFSTRFYLVSSSLVMFMLFLTLSFYMVFIITGKTYFGAMLGFVLSLFMDRVRLDPYYLLLFSLLVNLFLIVLMHIIIRSRRVSI